MTWAAPRAADAAPSKLISYQGRITDANGQPLADGPYSIRFKMYTASADCTGDLGTQVWTETQAAVQVTNGLFSAVLGTVTAFTQDFNSDYYLQVKVGANPVFSPCDRLTASPYAIRAVDANAASNANACNADATCETQAISATGDVTLATGVQIDFFDETGDKVYWYSNTYGTGIESSTLTDWSSSQFRWRIGGTSVSTGTEKLLLTSTGLTVTDDLTVSGTDIDLIRGDTSYIHSVGRISFDWTAGTYDTPDNHGITSKNEAGSFADALRINSYADVIVTIDSNANSVSYFKVQKESVGDGTDLLSLDESGNLTILGTISGGAINATSCSADATCETQSITVTGDITVSGGDIIGPGSVSIDIGESTVNAFTFIDAASISEYAQFYCRDSDGTNLCEFKTGIYNNGGTFYSQNQIFARSGIANDTAATKLSLNDADGVTVGGPLDVTGGAIQVDGNTVIDDSAGWHRTYLSTGWYNSTYGGGWHMTDTAWIRSYGSKDVYIDTKIRADGGYYKWADAADQPIIKQVAYAANANASCPTGWRVTACYRQAAGGTVASVWGPEPSGAGEPTTGNVYPPNDCPSNAAGYILCVYAP